jgi:peptidoglycan/LPS O-acetylase OafA/YrhL
LLKLFDNTPLVEPHILALIVLGALLLGGVYGAWFITNARGKGKKGFDRVPVWLGGAAYGVFLGVLVLITLALSILLGGFALLAAIEFNRPDLAAHQGMVILAMTIPALLIANRLIGRPLRNIRRAILNARKLP